MHCYCAHTHYTTLQNSAQVISSEDAIAAAAAKAGAFLGRTSNAQKRNGKSSNGGKDRGPLIGGWAAVGIETGDIVEDEDESSSNGHVQADEQEGEELQGVEEGVWCNGIHCVTAL
jgi:hypothetical protein